MKSFLNLCQSPEFIDGWVTSTQLLGHVIENIKISNGLINFYLSFIKMTTFLQRILDDTEVKILLIILNKISYFYILLYIYTVMKD